MKKDHNATVKLFEEAEKEVEGPGLRALIVKTLPAIKAHAEHAKSLEKPSNFWRCLVRQVVADF